ncbi:hypothetical protein SAMN02745784_01246 [Tissierella praeacuta DSM 18095]|jgi:cell fate (sporulation/competence/biofilm development) regulator YlbF (YheA/YmcA/DUF963 family)|uniref:Uncharacterized protein n=1 Tax=Tissierella praeacuta DSM 18095 TaxID=1123404 RepID=A0A1M4UXG2_9FIRM|nr:hypothetical protein [Tissierella praeacuta]SHE61431.1 hypothetical protein SAMN02745784_01246 [Tissierella praeacuta DSM 18095]SUP02678.1 Uncharacterised protein [Tissierella praeacuta]
MEDIMEILEDAICERLEVAYFELIKENEELKESIETVKELGTKLYENKDIPKEVRRQIEDYEEISNFIEGEMQKFIYMEGIKDCIKLLKLIGIL